MATFHTIMVSHVKFPFFIYDHKRVFLLLQSILIAQIVCHDSTSILVSVKLRYVSSKYMEPTIEKQVHCANCVTWNIQLALPGSYS